MLAPIAKRLSQLLFGLLLSGALSACAPSRKVLEEQHLYREYPSAKTASELNICMLGKLAAYKYSWAERGAYYMLTTARPAQIAPDNFVISDGAVEAYFAVKIDGVETRSRLRIFVSGNARSGLISNGVEIPLSRFAEECI